MDRRAKDHSITVLLPGHTVERLPWTAIAQAKKAHLIAFNLDCNSVSPEVLSGFTRVEVPFFEQSVYLGYREGYLFVFPEPKLSLSSPSGARYLARSADKRHGVLIQLLPPLTHTSYHLHTAKRERFFPLAGACRIGIDGEESLLDGCNCTVDPNTLHYLRTEGEAALNLLVIQGHPTPLVDPLTMDDHHYAPFPDHRDTRS